MWRGKKPRGCEEGSGCHSWIQRLRGPSTRGLCFDSHILSVSQEWEILEFFPAPRSLQWPLLTSCYKTWLGDFSTRKTNEENYHIQHFPRLLGIFCLTPVSHSIFPKRKFSSGEQAMPFITVFFPVVFPPTPFSAFPSLKHPFICWFTGKAVHISKQSWFFLILSFSLLLFPVVIQSGRCFHGDFPKERIQSDTESYPGIKVGGDYKCMTTFYWKKWSRWEEIWAGWAQPGRARPEGDQLLVWDILINHKNAQNSPKKELSSLRVPLFLLSRWGWEREVPLSYEHFHSILGLAPFPPRICNFKF